MSDWSEVTLKVNGEERTARVGYWTTLLDALREQFRLTGAKKGCNQGVCGACTVLMDGRPARACLSLAANCTEREITTIEGLSDGGKPTPLQQAFVDGGAVQCGFCTSGMILSAHTLLGQTPKPSEEEIRQGLSGNMCRCTGYRRIVKAVQSAAEG